MRGKYREWILAIAAAAVPASACAMTAPQPGPCRILNGERLPAETGGETAVCSAFEKAIAEDAPGARYDNIEIEVFSKTGLGAKVLQGGRELASQRFAIIDKDLNAASIERFARSLAAEVAKGQRT